MYPWLLGSKPSASNFSQAATCDKSMTGKSLLVRPPRADGGAPYALEGIDSGSPMVVVGYPKNKDECTGNVS